MKIAVYLRTSKTEQNLDNQRIPLQTYCKAQGWEYTMFEEQESTRKTRPVQYDLYNRLLKKEFAGVLIYKFDRWARSTVELINHLNEFNNRGIRFISYSENVDLGTPSGKLMFSIIAAMAEFERDLIRERTIAGLARARAQGKKLGRPPKKGTNHSRPSRAQVSELLDKGMSIREIAKELGTSKYWAHTVVKEVKGNEEDNN